MDEITNFNPSTDTLEIDSDSFGMKVLPHSLLLRTKGSSKSKEENDFLSAKKGCLYFNENGADK